jgi:hypothetical protein
MIAADHQLKKRPTLPFCSPSAARPSQNIGVRRFPPSPYEEVGFIGESTKIIKKKNIFVIDEDQGNG